MRQGPGTDLVEIYAALENDAFLIEECLARPSLVERIGRESGSRSTRRSTSRARSAAEDSVADC